MNFSRALTRLATVVALVAMAGCAESPSEPLAPGVAPQLIRQPVPISTLLAEATIGPEGGTLHIPGGHTLAFPAGAVDAPTVITASRDPNSIAVDFGPEGLVFPAAARPRLTYDYGHAVIPPWVTPGSLQIVYIDGSYIEELTTTVDTTARTVSANLEHFSTYALATD